MVTQVTNPSYDRLSGTGTVNERNRVVAKVLESNEIGVEITRASSHAPTSLEVTVPIKRSGKGSRRTLSLPLNGTQARALYEALNKFYSQAE